MSKGKNIDIMCWVHYWHKEVQTNLDQSPHVPGRTPPSSFARLVRTRMLQAARPVSTCRTSLPYNYFIRGKFSSLSNSR